MKSRKYKKKRSITKHGAPRNGTYISKDRNYYSDKQTAKYHKKVTKPSLLSRLFKKK